MATGKANVLLQFGLRKAADLPKVRLLQELAGNDKDRQIFEYLGLVGAMGRPFFMSAGTSAERAAVMRAAFVATMKDPAFLEGAGRSKLEIGPLSGDELTRIAGKTFEASADVLAAAKAAMEMSSASSAARKY